MTEESLLHQDLSSATGESRKVALMTGITGEVVCVLLVRYHMRERRGVVVSTAEPGLRARHLRLSRARVLYNPARTMEKACLHVIAA